MVELMGPGWLPDPTLAAGIGNHVLKHAGYAAPNPAASTPGRTISLPKMELHEA